MVALHNHVFLGQADHHLDRSEALGRGVNDEPSRSANFSEMDMRRVVLYGAPRDCFVRLFSSILEHLWHKTHATDIGHLSALRNGILCGGDNGRKQAKLENICLTILFATMVIRLNWATPVPRLRYCEAFIDVKLLQIDPACA